MHITITTSSRKIYNVLENAIISHQNSPRYTSRTDFIEHLFDLSRTLDNGRTTLYPDSDWLHRPELNQHVKIISGSRPTHSHKFYIDETSFIYP